MMYVMTVETVREQVDRNESGHLVRCKVLATNSDVLEFLQIPTKLEVLGRNYTMRPSDLVE
jgi:hypothetical protein